MKKLLLNQYLPHIVIISGALIAFGSMSSVSKVRFMSNIIICIVVSLGGLSLGFVFTVIINARANFFHAGIIKKIFIYIFPSFIGSVIWGAISGSMFGISAIWGSLVGFLIFLSSAGTFLFFIKRSIKNLPKDSSTTFN